MTQDFSFILDGLRYSNSSTSIYNLCALQFKLSYIDVKTKVDNWFGQFGSVCHSVLEKYFKSEIDIFQMSDEFKNLFYSEINTFLPSFQSSLSQKYFDQAIEFFNNFSFDRNLYDILFIEDFIESEIDGIRIIVRPDLAIKDKLTNEIILMDYKTSSIIKSGRLDKKKLESYKQQLFLYSYFIEKERNIRIGKIKIWFIRESPLDQIQEMCYTQEDGERTIKEFLETVSKIKTEQDWKPKPKIDYFCEQICSVRLFCPFYVSKFGLDISNQFVPE